MATPTGPSKRLYACGSKRGTTWGTAVAVGALDGILAKGDGGFALVQKYEQYPAIDEIMPMDGILGLIGPCDFTPPVGLQYEMGRWGSWLAAIFGTAGVPAQQGETAAYKHTFQWADFVTHFFTVVQERPGKIWECASAMPFKVAFKPEGSYIGAVLALRGNTIVDDSATNTATQVDALTYANRGKFVNFVEGKLLMNAQSGAGLSDPTDKIEFSDFDLSFERAIDAVHVLGSSVIALPKEGGFPKNTLKVMLPRVSDVNMAYFSTFKAMTAQKVQLVFTGPLIAAPYYYSVSFVLPRIRFAGPPDAKFEDIIKAGLTFEIEAAAAAPTGMAYARPYMEVINTQTTDYLA